MQETKVPDPQVVYGKVIYWLCIVAASISVIGPVLAITFPDSNFMNPSQLLSTIWEGNDHEVVWLQAGGGFPGGHFWLRYLNTWDGITQLGLVIGCAGVFLALLATSIAFLREKPRSYGWALVCLLVSSMVLLSAAGVVAV
jgi:drug/metabolite transporter (DMT)-like permease